MKNICLAFVIASLYWAAPAYSQLGAPAPMPNVSAIDPKRDGPELDETLGWITEKVNVFGHKEGARTSMPPEGKGPAHYKFRQNVAFNGCNIAIKGFAKDWYPDSSAEPEEWGVPYLTESNLSQLDDKAVISSRFDTSRFTVGPVQYTEIVEGDVYFITLSGLGGKQVWKERGGRSIADLALSIEGVDMAARLVKALKHAIGLCQAQAAAQAAKEAEQRPKKKELF